MLRIAATPILLLAVAITQALAMFAYFGNAIVVTGQLFFPLFLAGVAIYFGAKGAREDFGTVRLALLIGAVILALLTLLGWSMPLYTFYPSVTMYYVAFALLLISAIVAVASTPSSRSQRAEAGEAHDDEVPR